MLDYKIIGERLKKARKSKGITQEKLSHEIGVSIAFLSRIEKGSSQISLKRLSQVCNILQIEAGQILNGSSEDSNEYLNTDFKMLLDKSTEKQKKMIYEVAKTILDN